MSVKPVLGVFLCLIAVFSAVGQQPVNVIESDISAHTELGQLKVRVPIESGRRSDAQIELSLLDPNDKVVATSKSRSTIGLGRTTIESIVRISEDSTTSELIWYRVAYSVESDDSKVVGIVSLSEILPDLFVLRLINYQQIVPGARFPVRIAATHPVTNKPIGGVVVRGVVEIEIEGEDSLKLKGEAQTDENGLAEIVFLIPKNLRFGDGNYSGDIEIKGEHNGISDFESNSVVTPNDEMLVYYFTDKRLYQPGQTFHARGLVMKRGETSRSVVPGLAIEFRIMDEEGTVLNQQRVTTSEFGIASVEWRIPANAKLGTYRIEAKAEDIEFRSDTEWFRVSRYDLPNFLVQAKPDREFYLPDQREAKVTVSADYLFGKPVASGTVRVVREGNREWNYHEQRMEVEEKAVYEGETDETGKFEAKIDLSAAQSGFKEDNSTYEDLTFTAYFTDSSSNRTEQRRFDLRLSKQPIHIYLAHNSRGSGYNPKIPHPLFITTFTADGQPVSCDITLNGKYENEPELRPLAKLRTDKNGNLRTEFVFPKPLGESIEDLVLSFEAVDTENRKGSADLKVELADDEAIRVSTDRTIYRRRQPIDVEIRSSEKSVPLVVDILRGASAIETRRIRTRNGKARIRFPYRPEFKGLLSVAAHVDGKGDEVEDFRRIVYPDPKRLNISVNSDKQIYKPGDEAELSFSVKGPGKGPSALGVAIIDQAVEERFRTDWNSAPNPFADFSEFSASSWTEIDERKITPEMQFAAESRFLYENSILETEVGFAGRVENAFSDRHQKLFEPIETALAKRFAKDFRFPNDDPSFRRILSEAGIDFDALRDPWGTPYRLEFKTDRQYLRVDAVTAGPNKRFGDTDDFPVSSYRFEYFAQTAALLSKAIRDFETRTGAFVREPQSLRTAAIEGGIDLDSIRDNWGRPYRMVFGIEGRGFTVELVSDAGSPDVVWDDFRVFFNKSDYFSAIESRINAVLSRKVEGTNLFPKGEAEFIELLRANGIDLPALRDGWGRPYYFVYEETSVFADRVEIQSVAKPGEKPVESLKITPVTRRIGTFRIISVGENGTRDDAPYDLGIASFAGILWEQAKEDSKPKFTVPRAVLANGQGAIYGVVTDANDARIPSAEITVIDSVSGAEYPATANAEGAFIRTGLPAGRYSVKVTAANFKDAIVNQVNLAPQQIIELNVSLEVGTGAISLIVVTADDGLINTTDTSVSSVTTVSLPIPRTVSGGVLTLALSGQRSRSETIDQETGDISIVTRSERVRRNATPRVRDYFPETLVFVPELVTEADGRITFRYRMADNITTWKVYSVASDKEGRVGLSESEVRTFQPFFVDLDPPKFLTVGDSIRLPVQIRNYTSATEDVRVKMDRAEWFEFDDSSTNPGERRVQIASNATQSPVFGYRAKRPVTDGRQRVTAVAEKESDAIERTVTVRPDGEEIVRTDAKIFNGAATFDLEAPPNALAGTPTAEVRIYPNLMSHVTESIEGLIQRPYGCGEQTISSAYPNLMLLRSGMAAPSLETKARENLQRGYEMLVGFRRSDGGISYWGGNDVSDIALSAYAIRFLSDARPYVNVDPDIVKGAAAYLVAKQRNDGSWTRKYPWENEEDLNRTKMLTAYVARMLAMSKLDSEMVSASLKSALVFLKKSRTVIDEPYSIAQLGLAAFDSGDLETARAAAAKLREIAKSEGNGIYWNLETNTPFYGWGTAGRVETTALAMQLLVKTGSADDLIGPATMFLMKNKDRYGVWYSTQTTINVLDGLLATLKKPAAHRVVVSVGDEIVRTIDFPANQIEPTVIDLKGKIAPGSRLRIVGTDGTQLMAHLTRSHYIDWNDSVNVGRNLNDSRALRLDYSCDRLVGKVLDTVNCSVEAERIGFRGYGMLLAEIGIPPGADVSRELLDEARKAGQFSRYEVLPDRIIFYLWAVPGGSKFRFSFKPRYGIEAKTPASFIYDYYNEEARAAVAPLSFKFTANE